MQKLEVCLEIWIHVPQHGIWINWHERSCTANVHPHPSRPAFTCFTFGHELRHGPTFMVFRRALNNYLKYQEVEQ